MNNNDDLEILTKMVHSLLKDTKSLDFDVSQLVDEHFWDLVKEKSTYRIVDMYRKSKAVKGIHYDSEDNPILAYRVDKRHSLLFGLIHYWDYGAYNLCPEYLFPSVDKAEEAILKVDKSRRVTILHE